MTFAEKMVLSIFGVGFQITFSYFFFLNFKFVCGMEIKEYGEINNCGENKWMQLLIVLWMTRRITDDIPGWGALFDGLVGDGSVSVSSLSLYPKYYN